MVEVTQTDKDTAAELFRDERTALSVKFSLGHDPAPLLEAFARHRIAAEQRGKLEGARLAIEAAAKLTEDLFCSGKPHERHPLFVAKSIRALSPAKIVGEW